MIDPEFLEMERREMVTNDFPKFPTEEKSENRSILISSNPGLRLRTALFYEDDLREAKRARDARINKNIVNGSFATIFELDNEELKEDKIWRKAPNDIR